MGRIAPRKERSTTVEYVKASSTLGEWLLLQFEEYAYIRWLDAKPGWVWSGILRRYEMRLLYWLKIIPIWAKKLNPFAFQFRRWNWIIKVLRGRGRHWWYPKRK